MVEKKSWKNGIDSKKKVSVNFELNPVQCLK